jgi:hypothetical protein
MRQAVLQARLGSVAQKKAMLEAHYARKRKVEADAEGGPEGDLAVGDEDCAASLSLSTEGGSSCMTGDAAPGQEACGGGADFEGAVECGGGAGDGEAVQAITDSVSSACRMDEATDAILNREVEDALPSQRKDSCSGHLVSTDAAEERQPLKLTAERSLQIPFVTMCIWATVVTLTLD